MPRSKPAPTGAAAAAPAPAKAAPKKKTSTTKRAPKKVKEVDPKPLDDEERQRLSTLLLRDDGASAEAKVETEPEEAQPVDDPEPEPETEPEAEQESGQKQRVTYWLCDENGKSLKRSYTSRSGPYAAASKAANRLETGAPQIIRLRRAREKTIFVYECERVKLEPADRSYMLTWNGKRRKLTPEEKAHYLKNALPLKEGEKVVSYMHKPKVRRVRAGDVD
jgi:hypothetical protein